MFYDVEPANLPLRDRTFDFLVDVLVDFLVDVLVDFLVDVLRRVHWLDSISSWTGGMVV